MQVDGHVTSSLHHNNIITVKITTSTLFSPVLCSNSLNKYFEFERDGCGLRRIKKLN